MTVRVSVTRFVSVHGWIVRKVVTGSPAAGGYGRPRPAGGGAALLRRPQGHAEAEHDGDRGEPGEPAENAGAAPAAPSRDGRRSHGA